MQTIIEVVCSPGRSLRDAIADDRRLPRSQFDVLRERKPGRSPGWTKLRSRAEDRRGSLNIQWNSATKILTCRVINKGSGRPNLVVGDFVDYLLRSHRRRVRLITVIPS